MTLMVRSDSDPTRLAAAVREQIAGLDPELPVSDVRLLEDVVASSLNQPRFTMILLGLFAAVALALSAVGIYGVLAQWVGQRTHEIGIRMALGAESGRILRLVVGQGMSLALVGLGLGTVGALAVTPWLNRLLFGVRPRDPVTFVGMGLVLAAIALAACYVPARRATRVDPMVALRYE